MRPVFSATGSPRVGLAVRILEDEGTRRGVLHGQELLADPLLEGFHEAIRRPHGIVLLCGPTGSGKSTTLYAALREINRPEINIVTVEDPIEYYLDGISQTQVNAKVDMSFARGLRAILRQDPDVVMVGEIRDLETAEIAVQASLTGHIVFSTLHTNDAPATVTRLKDMGIQPFMICATVEAILAQRLVRRLFRSTHATRRKKRFTRW